MKPPPLFRLGAALFWAVLLGAMPARSQPAPAIAVTGQNGANLSLRVDSADYLALPLAEARRLLEQARTQEIRLREAEETIAAKDHYIASLEETNATFEKHMALQRELLTHTQTLYEGYRDIYADLRKAGPAGEPWLALSGGLGAVRESVGPETDLLPVFLMGVSVKRISVWGFVNAEQSGLIFGLRYPLRFSLF